MIKQFSVGILSLLLVTSAYSVNLSKHEVPNAGQLRTVGAETEVEVYFWYGCTYCHAIEAHIEEWAESRSDIELFLVPSTLDESWVSHAKTYLIAEELGLLHRTHDQAYKNVRENPSTLGSVSEVSQFLARATVTEAQAVRHYWSPVLEARIERERKREAGYGILGTPAIVVNGSHVIYPGVQGPEAFIAKLNEFVQNIASNIERGVGNE